MRIHRLEIEAFGPFAGRVDVDLDRLSDAGLFLLTGATGAGKTSVLDAVCFALYGAVPGDRQSAKRLRSDLAAPGVAPTVVMELTLAGRRLRIDRSPAWERPKKRGTGTTTVPARVLVTERVAGSWQPVATRLDEAGHLLGELLGMNLTQFCQVQLLPQGRFQAFLRADSKERHSLLHKLFRTARFEAVEAWLRERRRELRRESARLHEQVAGLVSRISEAADEPLPDDWDTHALDPVAADLEPWAASLHARAVEQQRTTAAQAAAASEAEARARRRLEHARRLLERRERLLRARAEHAELLEAAAEHDQRVARLDAARRAAAVLPLCDAASSARTGLEVAEAELDRALAQVTALLGTEVVDEATLRAQQDAAAAGAAAAKARRPLVDEQEELRRAIEDVEAALADIDTKLERLADRLRDLPGQLEERRARESELQRACDRLPEARQLADDAAARLAAGRRVAELVARRTAAEARHRASVDHAQELKERWLTLQERRLTGMAAEIAGALAVGASCPVCGSHEHPRPAQPAPDAPDAAAERAARRAVDDAEATRLARAEAVRDLDVEIAQAREQAGHRTVPVLEREAADAAAVVERLEARARGLASATADREAAERALEEATALQGRLAAEQARLAAARDEQRRRAATITAELTEVLAGTGFETVDQLAGHLAEVDRACSSTLEARAGAARARRALDEAEGRAEATAREHGFAAAQDADSAALPPEAVADLDRRVRSHEQRLAAVAATLGDPELQDAPDAAAPDVEELEKEHTAAAGDLSHARAAEAVTERRVVRLRRLRDDLVAALHAWQPVRAQFELADRMAAMVDGSSPDNRLRMRLSGYVLAFRLQQVVAAANERLSRMTDGRYQLEHAGARGAGESRGGLSLRVRDDWTGESRDPVTLSGGETFVVSLALALGLSDVISHEAGGAELDTLFVDEGFGMLDSDTLDDVMDTLDALRDGGRVVGVVSHVPELRDRIPTQLHVRKLRTGSTVHHIG